MTGGVCTSGHFQPDEAQQQAGITQCCMQWELEHQAQLQKCASGTAGIQRECVHQPGGQISEQRRSAGCSTAFAHSVHWATKLLTYWSDLPVLNFWRIPTFSRPFLHLHFLFAWSDLVGTKMNSKPIISQISTTDCAWFLTNEVYFEHLAFWCSKTWLQKWEKWQPQVTLWLKNKKLTQFIDDHILLGASTGKIEGVCGPPHGKSAMEAIYVKSCVSDSTFSPGRSLFGGSLCTSQLHQSTALPTIILFLWWTKETGSHCHQRDATKETLCWPEFLSSAVTCDCVMYLCINQQNLCAS